MYILQAILLILKLLPSQLPLFHWATPEGKIFPMDWPIQGGLFTFFSAVHWGIILIPSYFILGRAVMNFFFLKLASDE
jgi:hypothetical protein